MDLLEMMKTRRSIRKYKDTPVEKEKLQMIMDAGLYAPNPGGRQGTKIIIIDNKELIRILRIMLDRGEIRLQGDIISLARK